MPFDLNGKNTFFFNMTHFRKIFFLRYKNVEKDYLCILIKYVYYYGKKMSLFFVNVYLFFGIWPSGTV